MNILTDAWDRLLAGWPTEEAADPYDLQSWVETQIPLLEALDSVQGDMADQAIKMAQAIDLLYRERLVDDLLKEPLTSPILIDRWVWEECHYKRYCALWSDLQVDCDLRSPFNYLPMMEPVQLPLTNHFIRWMGELPDSLKPKKDSVARQEFSSPLLQKAFERVKNGVMTTHVTPKEKRELFLSYQLIAQIRFFSSKPKREGESMELQTTSLQLRKVREEIEKQNQEVSCLVRDRLEMVKSSFSQQMQAISEEMDQLLDSLQNDFKGEIDALEALTNQLKDQIEKQNARQAYLGETLAAHGPMLEQERLHAVEMTQKLREQLAESVRLRELLAELEQRQGAQELEGIQQQKILEEMRGCRRIIENNSTELRNKLASIQSSRLMLQQLLTDVERKLLSEKENCDQLRGKLAIVSSQVEGLVNLNVQTRRQIYQLQYQIAVARNQSRGCSLL